MDRSPFTVRKGAEGARRADRGEHTSSLPRFGPHGCVKPYSCFGLYCVLGSGARRATVLVASYTERESDRRSEPPLRCAWASFYRSKESPTGGNVGEGKNVKMVVVVTVYAQCFVPN